MQFADTDFEARLSCISVGHDIVCYLLPREDEKLWKIHQDCCDYNSFYTGIQLSVLQVFSKTKAIKAKEQKEYVGPNTCSQPGLRK